MTMGIRDGFYYGGESFSKVSLFCFLFRKNIFMRIFKWYEGGGKNHRSNFWYTRDLHLTENDFENEMTIYFKFDGSSSQNERYF